MKRQAIRSETEWFRLESDEADWAAENPADLARWMEQLLVIRRFEEKILELHGQGLVHGPAHASIGQEAGAVGAMSILNSGDKINGTHRAHHQILAKLLNHATPAGYDPRRDAPAAGAGALVQGAMAEIMGLRTGFCGGRGGSMHMRHAPSGVVGSSAIIGGNVPHAVGYGLADKVLGRDQISVAFFGDGTLMAGQTLEAINLAALYTLPVIFFLENNFYAVSTHVREQTRETRLTGRGAMFGVPSIECDGMDVIAVRRAMQWAAETIRARGGPVFIEAICYRFLHQSGPLHGSQLGYRSKEEEAEWRARDPLLTMPARLKALGVLDDAGLVALEARARAMVEDAAAALTETDPGANAPRVRPGLYPSPSEVDKGIRGDLSELRGEAFREAASVPAEAVREMKYIDAVAATLVRNMERDPRIVVIGEDVHRLRGGVSGSTRGVMERFPERVFATPICENGFTGMALGAALCGLRPVVDIMFGDFTIVAADQMFNGIGKFAHMFGGGFGIPLVVRARVNPGAGYGSQHSMDPSAIFAMYPGWRIVSPSTPHDYVGLMNSALRCEDPVLMIEHQDLFQTTGPVPEDLDYCVELGKARIAKPGSACTVLTYSAMVRASEEAAVEAGIDAEVIDLRTLDPQGIDWAAVEDSIRRTNRVLIAEQTARGTSHGARLAQEVQERCFDWLDAEILRVSGSESAPVVSKPLNMAALADAAKVAAGLRRLLA
ncbi:alpha-ketoacid dehydrogenase subunit alpha/beta [Roseomonas xinghualingensis]|uniref:alpha-ketoacid dehydrogenase subunit alpha/beta n=1 Tax=Roseomonas xinghualingensis TaxID=2986475 RepID=UPI0021F165D1|nr:alpha-ketoacid dehydrogenase subunit alpha/beta [Roseomonas sp. SXEYE001]MCV4206666.1 thiamine pyrophosphate-dependent enzyme [Roseomonas sp. SXEYE001]